MATLTDKEKGDKAFKARNYPSAIGHWSAAIVADPSDPLIPLNRAAAYLKLDKFKDAERDCTTTLSLAPGNVKAWFRRAHARRGQLMLQEALHDFQRAFQLDPALAAAKTNIDELVKQLPDSAATKSPPVEFNSPPLAGASTTTTPQPAPLGTALEAPPTAPATPLRRIPITIVEPPNAPPSPPDSAPEPTTPALDPLFDLPDPFAPRVNLDDFPENPDDEPPAPYWSHHWSPYYWENTARGTYARAGTVASTSQAEQEPTSAPEDQEAVHAELEAARRAAKEALWGVTPPPPPLPAPAQTPPVPAPTLITFTRAWDAAHTPEARWAVLATLPPSSLPALFQNSLEPGFLSALLSTFTALLDARPEEDELKAWIRAYMVALERVPRVGFVALLAGREAGRAVWTRVLDSGEGGGVLWTQ